MRLSTFLSTAALALTANAFLIPLEVADKAIASNPSVSITTAKQRTAIPCTSCPVALEDGTWKTEIEKGDPESRLMMDFVVEDKQLKLNGVPIFPPQNAMPLRATQELQHNGNGIKPFRQPILLSTSIDIQPTMIRGKDGLMKLHVISLEVIGLQDKVVRIPSLKIRLAELPNGQVRPSVQYH